MTTQSNGHNDKPTFDTLDEVVQHALQTSQAPGVSVGIMQRGEIVEQQGYGIISLGNNYPTHPDTLFQIGSNTKVFTCTAVMRLVDQGKIDLNAPVKQYIPDLQLADEKALETITVRHLLTHTSGLEGDRFENTGNGDDALDKFVGMAYTWAQETDPGEFWSYCNSGWGLAGKIIANITGQTYEAAMKELVFDPLGLDRAFFFAEEAIVYSAAAGHNQYPGQDAPVVALPWPIPRASNPAGAIVSNVQSLLTFCNFHMGDGRVNGEQILSPASIAAMQTVEARITEGSEWGLGWALETNGDGTRIIRHGGGTNGHITMMSAIPAQKFAISVLTNSSKGGEVIKAVEEWAFAKYCGVTITKPEATTLSLQQLERLTGVYRQTTATTEITVEDDHLLATVQMKHPLTNEELSMPGEKLFPISEWEVMTEDGSRVQFIPGAGGRPRFLRMGRLARRES